ncbi:hypothetical protein [Arcticibacter tournemirensis]
MEAELNYPVIVLSRKDDMVYVYFNDKDLKSTSEELLKKLDYTNLDLIDRVGHKYKINKAFKVKYLGLWGFNPLLKGRQILIDFKYDPEVQCVSLDDFKDEIVKRLEKKKRFWEASWDVEELKQKVSHCPSFSGIAELLK